MVCSPLSLVSATSANHYSIAPGAQRFSRSSPGPGRPRSHEAARPWSRAAPALPEAVETGAGGLLVRAARAVVETTLGELLPHTFSKRHLA
jgi:hypothetical protein